MTQKLQPQKEITVDGETYLVQLYSPTFGLTLYSKLCRLLGPSILKMVDLFGADSLTRAKGGSFSFDGFDADAAGAAVQSLFEGIKDEELVPLLKEILSQTFAKPSLDNVAETFETRFVGRYLHLFKLVAKTVGVQYADFLGGIVKRSNAARPVRISEKKEDTGT